MQFLVDLVTPFDSRGRVDLARLRAHVLWLSMQGVDGFVVTGITGEFLYLSDREREAVHRTVLDTARNKTVHACTWDPSPTTTRYLTEAAREQGADAILMPPPLLYGVPDDVVGSWYRKVREMSGLPVLAYHDPFHFHTAVNPDLYASLREDDVLGGMHDSSRDVFRLKRLCKAEPNLIYAGGDKILGQVRSVHGCAGFVSEMANAWPGFCKRVLEGDAALDEALIDRVNRVRLAGGHRAIKTLLRMGCRLPLGAPDRTLVDGLPASEMP